MYEEKISSGERRRRAPLHHEARADNARFAAYALWHATPEQLESWKLDLPYGGTTSVAIHEAFLREASLALELIVKAVIAMRIEGGTAPKTVNRVRPSHDVLTLWESDAVLPVQPAEDRMTLALAHSILRWAGRYAAPNEDRVYEEELEREEMIQPFPKGPTLKIRRGRSISWEQFNRLYMIASREFWRLYESRWGHLK